MIWDKLAQTYDNLWVQKYSLTPSREYVVDYINKNYENNSTVRILDAGCATGQCLCGLASTLHNSELIGFDKSPRMIEQAIEKNNRISFFEYNIDKLTDLSHKHLLDNSFDFLICTHSFPYYQHQSKALAYLLDLLKTGGKAIFIQGSVNNIFDKCVFRGIEQTAEAANYLSIFEFKKLLPLHIKIEEEFIIRKKWFIPTIAGFVLRKI